MIELEQIVEIRKDTRTVIFTQKRADQSIILTEQRLDNDQFVELLQDQNIQIIF